MFPVFHRSEFQKKKIWIFFLLILNHSQAFRICSSLFPCLPSSLSAPSNPPPLYLPWNINGNPLISSWDTLGCKCDQAPSPVGFVPIEDHPNRPLRDSHQILVSRNERVSVTHSKRTFHQNVGQALSALNLGSPQWTNFEEGQGRNFGEQLKKKTQTGSRSRSPQ